MTNNIFIKAFLLSLSFFPATGVIHAQLNESINVEGKYMPEYIHADRIYTFPERLDFNVQMSPLSYQTKGVAAAFDPDGRPMPALAWRGTRTVSRHKGYLDLGLGSWLNSTLSAGYAVVDSETTRAGIRLQYNSISLWHPDLQEALKDVKQFRYDVAPGVYFSKAFRGKGTLSASLDYHVGYFNYYGFNPYREIPEGVEVKAPTQTLNDISFRAGWNSEQRVDDVVWNVGAGVRHFGYRGFYFNEENPYGNILSLWPLSIKGTRETHVDISGGILFPTSSSSAIGVDACVDVLAYAGDGPFDLESGLLAGGSEVYSIEAPDTYGMFSLTPYYTLNRNNLNLRLGAQVDFAFKAGMESSRYGVFHIAPSVKLDYNAGIASLFLHALGGSRLNTLAAGFERDYYQTPLLLDTSPVYTPLDASLGADFGPFSGFSAGIELDYRISRSEILGGWYTYSLNHPSTYVVNDAVGDGTMVSAYLLPTHDARLNMHGMSVKANLKYDLGDIFSISLKGSYQPQKGSEGYFNGYDRPRITASALACVSPVRNLKIKLGYDYRGVRQIYINTLRTSLSGRSEERLEWQRLPDLTWLNAGVSYSITDNFSLWAQADNILNRHDNLLPDLPDNGIKISGGIGWVF